MKRTLFACAFTTTFFSHVASADWTAELNYTMLSEDSLDIELGVLGTAIGYQFNVSEGFVLTPEFRIGFGVSDDTIDDRFFVELNGGREYLDVDIEVDSYYGVGLRGQYYTTEKFYVLASVSYVTLDLEASISNNTITEEESDFGFGAGLGYAITKNSTVEATYETFDDTDVFKFGFRYSF